MTHSRSILQSSHRPAVLLLDDHRPKDQVFGRLFLFFFFSLMIILSLAIIQVYPGAEKLVSSDPIRPIEPLPMQRQFSSFY